MHLILLPLGWYALSFLIGFVLSGWRSIVAACVLIAGAGAWALHAADADINAASGPVGIAIIAMLMTATQVAMVAVVIGWATHRLVRNQRQRGAGVRKQWAIALAGLILPLLATVLLILLAVGRAMWLR
ncbi:MAG: hypothetical protein ACREP7_06790 [Lysobacter sp.]